MIDSLFLVGFCWLMTLFPSPSPSPIVRRTCRGPRCGLMISRSVSTSSPSKKASNLIDRERFHQSILPHWDRSWGSISMFDPTFAAYVSCTSLSAGSRLALALLTDFGHFYSSPCLPLTFSSASFISLVQLPLISAPRPYRSAISPYGLHGHESPNTTVSMFPHHCSNHWHS